MKTVYLKDHIETVLNECLYRNEKGRNYPRHVLKSVIDTHIKDGLRYRDGKTFCNSMGKIGEYVEANPVYENESDCAKWEFTGIIRSDASRLLNGYLK